MNKKRHKSDRITEDIIGAFKILIISVLVIYFSIAIINALPGVDFPIKTNSSWLVGVIIGILIIFVKYIKNKNKSYYS